MEDIILSNILMLKVMYMVNLHMQANITLNNYEEVLTNVSGAVRGAATNEMEQTASNLTVVAAAFARSAAQLVGEMSTIPNTVSSLQFYSDSPGSYVNTHMYLHKWCRKTLLLAHLIFSNFNKYNDTKAKTSLHCKISSLTLSA